MRIIYVAQRLASDGFKLAGRSLVKHLTSEHEVRVVGAIVEDASPFLQGDLADDVIPVSALPAVQAVYMEGGWNSQANPEDRFPTGAASDFVRRGGQLIVADYSRTVANLQAASITASQRLLHANAESE